jgi:hypothetical protein
VSLYETQKCIFHFLRAAEQANVQSAPMPDVNFDAYELTAEERRAIEEKDVGALYLMGLHPVLLNTYARTVGFSRNDYRKILEDLPQPERRRARWQTS